MLNQKIKLIECPRDAMQGLKSFIPTDIKAEYLNNLLQVGFDTLDFGSFVSPKAVPQMADTSEVLEKLNTEQTNTMLLAIIANRRGAESALQHEQIDSLGYPFSVSETFQQRNSNRSIEASLKDVEVIQAMCENNQKQLVVYLSMAFGNPYGDAWSPEVVKQWAKQLSNMGIQVLSLSDTVGSAKTEDVTALFTELIPGLPDIEIGAHFHVRPDNWRGIVEAAYSAGCRRFDSAMKGYGGCPMAKDDLTGNLATEQLVAYLEEKGEQHGLDKTMLNKTSGEALSVYEFKRG